MHKDARNSLVKTICFYLVWFLMSFKLKHKNCKLSIRSILFSRVCSYALDHSHTLAHNRRLSARIELKISVNVTKDLYINLNK